MRGRAGFAVLDNLLIYGTGGLAFGRTQYDGNIQRSAILLNFNVPAMDTVTKAGWTVGGGLEFAMSNRWTVKAEYLYYDLGSTVITGNQTPPPFILASSASYAFINRGSITRFGFNFKID